METTAPQSKHHPVVDDCRDQRDATIPEYTISQAIDDARWVQRTPDALITELGKAKLIIRTLLAGLESNQTYLKSVCENVPVFCLRADDKAGHTAMRAWIVTAEHHGARPEKVEDARRILAKWEQRAGLRWPT